MSTSSCSRLIQSLSELSEPLRESLAKTPYNPPEGYIDISLKSHLQSLLPHARVSEPNIPALVKDFVLCCAALASATDSTSPHLTWVSESLSLRAVSALKEFARVCRDENNVHASCSMKVGELELDLIGVVESEKKLLIELIPEVLPLLKGNIRKSSIDVNDENDGVSAASAKVPVAYAILSACQFRWFVTQVEAPYIGLLCPLLIPCALTALDHWSPQVKDQGMVSFIHLAKNVKATDIGGYGDVILDACCQNIASDDEIWPSVVEMSVLLITLTQQNNPRSPWYEKLFKEMLNHLERQPRNKQRRMAWLTHCESLLDGLGLVLLAHFRQLFPLFFKWMHTDDDETVLLVLERTIAVLKLTWIRNSPYIERLFDELAVLYKEAALRDYRETIRSLILQALHLLRTSRKPKFDATWAKYMDDPNLTTLLPLLCERDAKMVSGVCQEGILGNSLPS